MGWACGDDCSLKYGVECGTKTCSTLMCEGCGHSCEDCENNLAWCGFWQCSEEGTRYCSKCYDGSLSGKWSAFTCGTCDNRIALYHEDCLCGGGKYKSSSGFYSGYWRRHEPADREFEKCSKGRESGDRCDAFICLKCREKEDGEKLYEENGEFIGLCSIHRPRKEQKKGMGLTTGTGLAFYHHG